MAPRGDGSIYQTHGCGTPTDDGYPCQREKCPEGTWHASLVVNGKRHHRSSRDRAVVVSKLRTLRAEQTSGRVTSGRWPTVEEWIRYCLTEVYPSSGRVSEGTLDTYESLARTWIFPVVPGVRLDALTVAQARQIIYGPVDAGRAGSTARQVRAILSKCLRIAQQERGLLRNVAHLVDTPPLDADPIDPPTRRDARALLKVASGLDRGGARWVLALALGLRQGEALGLSWPDIDLDTGELQVRWQLKIRRGKHGCGPQQQRKTRAGVELVWPCGKKQGARCPSSDREAGPTLKAPKSAAGVRVVSMPDEVTAWLRQHREQQLAERLATPDWKPWSCTPVGERRARRVDLVFTQPNGRPVSPRADWEAWKTLLADANVPEARLHDARHTAATVLLEMGVDVKVVSAMLGHSSVALTQNTYQHLVPELRDDAADRMSVALFGDDEVGRKRRRRA
jgi:integrase